VLCLLYRIQVNKRRITRLAAPFRKEVGRVTDSSESETLTFVAGACGRDYSCSG